jgi:serine/threonine protein phosphatase PrpC
MPASQRQSFAVTHVGKVRESNEDSYVCRDELGLWAVADGMGGHEAGGLASRIVAENLECVSECNSLADLKTATRKTLDKANAELIGMADQFTPGLAAGSTVAVLLIRDDKGTVSWAGDSRVYRLGEGKLQQLTRDHSHIQSLIDEDMITPENAESHPLAHLITRAVGFDQPLALQSSDFEVNPGDRYLLCSDGLSRVLSPADMERHMSADDLRGAVTDMLDATLQAGAPDNVTIVAVDRSG